MKSAEETKSFIEASSDLQTTFIGTRKSDYGVDEDVGVQDSQRVTHVASIGPTGYGKTQLMVHAMLQDAQKGYGFCFVNPKGKAVDQVIAKLPEDRVEDVIYINPGGEEAPAINVLDPHVTGEMGREAVETQKEIIISDVIDLFKRQSDNWGDRFGRILTTLLRAHLDLNIYRGEGNSLMDVFRCVVNDGALVDLIDRVDDPVIREQLVRVKEDLGSYELEPLQRRMNDFVENRVIRDVVASEESGVDFREAVDEGKILLVDIRKDQVGSSVSQIVGSITITQVWAAAQARMASRRSNQDPYFLYVDELQNFGNEGSNFTKILAEAREYQLGCWLATQNLENIESGKMQDAVINNCRSLVVFDPTGSKYENRIAKRLKGVSSDQFQGLNKYRAVVQTPGNGSQEEAVFVSTYPPWKADRGGVEEVKRERAAKSSETVLDLQVTTGQGKSTSPETGQEEDEEDNERNGPAGGDKHDLLLAAAQRELQSRGLQANVFYQEIGTEKADGQVILSDGSTANLEVENTSLSKPVKVLKNFKRAVDQGKECIFVVEEGRKEKLEGILDDPVNRRGRKHEDDESSFNYYMNESGDPFDNLDLLEDGEYRVIEIPEEELELDEGMECPELGDMGREELESFCVHRDDSGFCSVLGKQCVLTQ